jgi:hypothetical protein
MAANHGISPAMRDFVRDKASDFVRQNAGLENRMATIKKYFMTKGISMRFVILPIVSLFFALSVSARGGGDGSGVGNGGGFSEQAILFSAKQAISFVDACLKYANCGATEPLKNSLQKIKSCSLPSLNSFVFRTAEEVPELNGAQGAPRSYVLLNQEFVVNRTLLYNSKNEPLRTPQAMAYVTRMYFDLCGGMSFADSGSAGMTLASFAEYDSEQVTIGKDDLNLPIAEWIRVRTLYSDLIIESAQSIVRISCDGENLDACSLKNETASSTDSRFKDLSLVMEKGSSGQVEFEVEGNAVSPQSRKGFQLSAKYLKGVPVQIIWQGKSLEIPKN